MKSDSEPTVIRAELQPMDPQLTCIQPGGGVVYRLELAWGHLRRAFLKKFCPRYVQRMRELRQGDGNGCPHEVIDPRDLKFYRNQPNYWWAPEHDPFTWRDRLPFARVGLAELILLCLLFFGLAAAVTAVLLLVQPGPAWSIPGWLVVAACCIFGGLTAWFFRNPQRTIPAGPHIVVSPADGKVVTIETIEHDEFIGGPAVLVGIFLSIFNVHINRAPAAGRVIGLSYRPGKYLNALRPESARENERLEVHLESADFPHHRFVVRQITGAIARRIVCWLKPGDELEKGEQFGMIKLGSRTELLLPQSAGWEIRVRVGDAIQAGSTVIAQCSPSTDGVQ